MEPYIYPSGSIWNCFTSPQKVFTSLKGVNFQRRTNTHPLLPPPQADVLYDASTGARTSLMLSFPPDQLPTQRTSTALGCTLHAVLQAPQGSDSSRHVVIRRSPAV